MSSEFLAELVMLAIFLLFGGFILGSFIKTFITCINEKCISSSTSFGMAISIIMSIVFITDVYKEFMLLRELVSNGGAW